MPRLSLTYGTLPPVDAFNAAFESECPDGKFKFENDKRVGNVTMSRAELWRAIQEAVIEFETSDNPDWNVPQAAATWAGDVLSVLGIEWV